MTSKESSLSQPLVSAIVSTYNSARFIRGCIEDLEHQTIAHQLEIIVIDSASPQNEGEIVRELQGRYGNIRYVRTDQRETVYAAWNRGIAMAGGRYITNANTDDRHRSDAFELMVRVMESRPNVDLVYGDVLVTKTPNETFERHTLSGKYTWYDWDRNILLDQGCFIGPQPMWRRSLHELYGGFDPTYVTSGDYEFWLRISQTSDFFHIRQALGLYLAHPDSIEHRNDDKKGQENNTILNLYRQAAREGCVAGLLPFQQIRSFSAGISHKVPRADRTQLVDLIEALLLSKAALYGEQVGNYHRIKAKLLAVGEPSAPLIEEYVSGAEQLILGTKEWYVNRRSVENTTTDDALLRLEVLSTAIQKARLLSHRGHIDEAVSILLNQGIKAAASSPAAYFELADVLMAAERYEDALQTLLEMPPSADICRLQEMLALCYAALGQDEPAQQAALQAAGLPRALVTLGTLAARSGNLAEAEIFFRQAIETDPACGSAWLSLGMLLWGNGDPLGAYQATLSAVAVEPLNSDAVKILRDMAERNGRTTDVLQIISDTVQLYPDSRNLRRHYAELLAKCGREREALEVCEAFLTKFGVVDELLSLALHMRQHIGVYDRLVEAGAHSISLCMIVKNEDTNLSACLASIKPVVDEIIIVDTGSTDRTVDIATVFGARILHFPWNGNFSDARNCSLDAAKGSWILVMDADEVLSPQDYEVIRRAVRPADKKAIAWSVLTRNYTTRVNAQGWTPNDHAYPAEERTDGWHPSWKVRLFPCSRNIRFTGEVHEMLENALRESGCRISPANFVVHHYGGLQTEKNRQKMLHYFELGMNKLAGQEGDIKALIELAVQAGELNLFEEALALWDRVLALQPDMVEALFNKSYVFINLKRYREGLQASRRAFDLDPNHKEAAFNFGTCALYVGDPLEASVIIAPLSARFPDYPPLMALLTVLQLATDQHEQARTTYSELQLRNYAIIDYVRDRAATLELLGRSGMARKLGECFILPETGRFQGILQ